MTQPLRLASGHGVGLDEETEARRVNRLLYYWQSLRPVDGVPAFVDFDPRRNPLGWNQCFVLFRDAGDGFLFDHFGARLFPLVWTMPKTLSEVPQESVVARLLKGLPTVVAAGQPWSVAAVEPVRQGLLYHRSILLPFRDVRQRLSYVLGGMTFLINRA